jgi:hypothetical protein
MIVLPPASALLDEITASNLNRRWCAYVALMSTVSSKAYNLCSVDEQAEWLDRLIEYLELSRNAWRSAAEVRMRNLPAVSDLSSLSRSVEAEPGLQRVQQCFDVLAAQADGAQVNGVRVDDQSVAGVAKAEVGETRDTVALAGGR